MTWVVAGTISGVITEGVDDIAKLCSLPLKMLPCVFNDEYFVARLCDNLFVDKMDSLASVDV